MQLKLIKCDWGMEQFGSMPERLRVYAKAGYDGVECANIGMDASEFHELCVELGLDYVAMIFCDDEKSFREKLAAVKQTGPILVNCHAGRDHFDFNRTLRFFGSALEAASKIDTQVVFETHRTRSLYSAWQTERILRALPDLRITADFSHFTVVAESSLQSSPYSEMMDMAIARTDHIHARVGTSQSSQIADPRTANGMKWTELFERWWDRIIEERLAEHRPFLTITPEFGPPPYQLVNPVNEAPLADVWEVCLWMAERFRLRWEKLRPLSVQ